MSYLAKMVSPLKGDFVMTINKDNIENKAQAHRPDEAKQLKTIGEKGNQKNINQG